MSASRWAPMISRSSGGPLICLSAPLRRPAVPLGALWLLWWQRRDICGWPCQIWRTKTGSAYWTPRSRLLACSATLLTRSSTGFRRRVSKRRRSSGSSLAALGLRGLLDSSPRRVPAPHTGRLKRRALPLALPRGGARSSATHLGLQGRSRIWGPCLRLGGPRKRSPDTWGCRTSEGRPLWGRKELQGAYLSPVPSTLRSVRRKGTETHVTPEGVYKTDSSGSAWRCTITGVRATVSNTRGQPRETGSLSRLFGSMETTARCISMGPADCRKGVSNSVRLSTTALQRRDSHTGGPRAGSGYGTRSESPIKEGGHRGGPSSREGIRILQPVFHSSQKGWRVASDHRSASTEPLSQSAEVQDAHAKASCVTNQVQGLVCHDRSKRRILPRIHPSVSQEVPKVRFWGKAYQYRVLPFGLALSPRTFTKVVDAVLAPLRLQGIRILNYIDDWLILAQSEMEAARHRDVVLAHMKQLGLRLNAKKSVLSPVQRTTYLGVVWNSTMMQARMSPARIESIFTSVKRVREGQSLTVKQFQRLLGLMAAASNVIPVGLLYMRPLQWWLKTKGFSPRGNPLRMIRVSRRCVRALDMWRKPWFLNQGPVLGAPCRQLSLATDASLTGWGAVMSGRSARGLWSGRHLIWHINCLEMLAVFRALKFFLPDLRGHHVLVRTDNTAVVSYINHQGGLRSRPLYKLAHQILLWSQDKFLSLRALYIPGYLNVGPDVLSRQGPRPGEWMLHPEVVKQIWRIFYQAEVDLFATQVNAQCPLWFSLAPPAPLGLDAMVQTWPRLCLYAFPPIALLPGVLTRVRRDGVRLLLVAPYWPGRVWFSDLISLLDDSPWEVPIRRDLLSQAGGAILHPRPELWKLWVWPLRGHSS